MLAKRVPGYPTPATSPPPQRAEPRAAAADPQVRADSRSQPSPGLQVTRPRRGLQPQQHRSIWDAVREKPSQQRREIAGREQAGSAILGDVLAPPPVKPADAPRGQLATRQRPGWMERRGADEEIVVDDAVIGLSKICPAGHMSPGVTAAGDRRKVRFLMVVSNPPDLAGYSPGSGFVMAGPIRTCLLVPAVTAATRPGTGQVIIRCVHSGYEHQVPGGITGKPRLPSHEGHVSFWLYL
jgi:hypothetical protein